MGKINRFPKMMILWSAIFEEEYGFDREKALGLGWIVASYYAVMKNFKRGISKSTKKNNNGIGTKSKKSESPFEPNNSYNYESIVIPGNHPNFAKHIWIKSISKDGIYAYFNGKEYNITQKAIYQIKSKFGDMNSNVFKKYYEFAKQKAKELKNKFYAGWFKIWKEIRDLDWDVEVEQSTKKELNGKKKEAVLTLF